jgi:hypothetical protein
MVDQIAPGVSGLEQLKAMIAAGGRPPIGETLEFSLTEAGDGWATFEDAMGRIYATATSSLLVFERWARQGSTPALKPELSAAPSGKAVPTRPGGPWRKRSSEWRIAPSSPTRLRRRLGRQARLETGDREKDHHAPRRRRPAVE